MSDVVQKLWGFCHTLRHDGIDYGDYIEQITYLLFLKMADERGIDLPLLTDSEGRVLPPERRCDWPALMQRSGTELTEFYADVLRVLGRQPGILGDIFSGAQSRFNNPVNLRQLLRVIDETQWTQLNVDVKAEAFEGLLERAASEGKKGAGQYFTPRILIQSIARCVKPDPRERPEFTIGDPACGTGGFLVCAYEWFMQQTGGALDRDLARRVRRSTYYGQDLVDRPRRLALMNLYLHQLEPVITKGDSIYDPPSGQRFDVVLTNPPFGTKGANQIPERPDFTISTSNKQLNFLQHVLTILKPGGRAAVVVPDNCLFADQAGDVFAILTQDCDLHTVLRLPNGTFSPYSPGTKTNVVFFTKGAPTRTTWVYDARTNVPAITKKERPLSPEQFAEFERCFGADPYARSPRNAGDSVDDRWRSFSIEEVKGHHFKIDSLKWLKDESLDDPDAMPEPEELVTDALAELAGAVEDLRAVLALLENGNGAEAVA